MKFEKLPEGLKVAPNLRSCSKVAEQLMYSPTSDMSNGANETRVIDKGASPGRVAGGQQLAPGYYPATKKRLDREREEGNGLSRRTGL